MTHTNGTTGTSTRTTRSRASTASALDDVKARTQRDADLDPKTKESLKARRNKVKQDAAEMTIEKTTSAVAAAKVKITQTLDALNDDINSKLDELRLVNEAIAVAKLEFQQLHDNDVVLSSTADLIARHEQKMKELEEERKVAETAWQKAQEDHAAAVLERDRELEKARKREADDYNFNLGAKRRAEEQLFNEQVRVRNTQEQIRQEQHNRVMVERESALSAKEQEFLAYKAKADGFDVAVAAARDEAVTNTTKSLAKDNAATVERVRMERETDKRVFELENTNLRNAVKERDDQIVRLQNDLAAARQGVSDLATAAMESASGKKALDAVSQLQSTAGQKK